MLFVIKKLHQYLSNCVLPVFTCALVLWKELRWPWLNRPHILWIKEATVCIFTIDVGSHIFSCLGHFNHKIGLFRKPIFQVNIAKVVTAHGSRIFLEGCKKTIPTFLSHKMLYKSHLYLSKQDSSVFGHTSHILYCGQLMMTTKNTYLVIPKNIKFPCERGLLGQAV